MSLLPEGASYEEVVAEVFLAVSGRGLMLSALDGAVVSEWAQLGVPLEVVARGIRRAAEKADYDRRPGEPLLRSLRACRREVDAEWKKHLRASAGAGSSERETVSRSKPKKPSGAVGALDELAARRPELAEVLARAKRLLGEAREDRRDEAVVLTILRGCPLPERIAIHREAREVWEGGGAMSPRARKLSRRFHLVTVARRALGLPGFW